MEALKTPNRRIQGDAPTFTGTRIADNAAYLPVADVLSSAEALLEEYERLDRMISNMRDEQTNPMAETWHQDLEDTKQKLEMGARVALRNVKKVLGAEVDDDATDMDGDEDETLVEDEGLNYELQKSLRYVERGVKRTVKGLPADED
jgi:flagellar biosynthesis GTPase FlhF